MATALGSTARARQNSAQWMTRAKLALVHAFPIARQKPEWDWPGKRSKAEPLESFEWTSCSFVRRNHTIVDISCIGSITYLVVKFWGFRQSLRSRVSKRTKCDLPEHTGKTGQIRRDIGKINIDNRPVTKRVKQRSKIFVVLLFETEALILHRNGEVQWVQPYFDVAISRSTGPVHIHAAASIVGSPDIGLKKRDWSCGSVMMKRRLAPRDCRSQ